MRRNLLTIIAGAALAIIFALMLFFFQVRETQVAVVTTFGRYTRSITNQPGLYFRLPYPIQKIYRFDDRIQNFERKFEETTTLDGQPILITVYIGWKIADPIVFLQRFNGDYVSADDTLENLVRDAKNGVIGRHPLSDLISPDPKKLKFNQIEHEMLSTIQPVALHNYGIDVSMLGIKQLGFPESITSKVFDRMKQERQRLVKQFNGEGEAQALQIRADADRQRQEILARAQAQATEIRGEGDAAAAKFYETFEKNPQLAIYLLKLRALEKGLKKRATLIFDEKTSPFNLFKQVQTNSPAQGLLRHSAKP